MKPIIYGHLVSPPVRAVMMLVRQLNIDVEFKRVNLFKKEHLAPEFVKLTPMHTVPVLEHGDVLATDSHSILMYLVDKFSPDSTLFPQNLQQRTEVLNKLMFNAAYFFPRDSTVFRSIIHDNARDYSGHRGKIEEAYNCLEAFLNKNTFVAGPNMTIADFAILPTASTLGFLFPITDDKWPKTVKWIDELKRLSFYEEVNQKGLDELTELLKMFLNKTDA